METLFFLSREKFIEYLFLHPEKCPPLNTLPSNLGYGYIIKQVFEWYEIPIKYHEDADAKLNLFVKKHLIPLLDSIDCKDSESWADLRIYYDVKFRLKNDEKLYSVIDNYTFYKIAEKILNENPILQDVKSRKKELLNQFKKTKIYLIARKETLEFLNDPGNRKELRIINLNLTYL